MRSLFLRTLVAVSALVTLSAAKAEESPTLAVELVAADLSNPIFVTAPPNDRSRLFIVEQTGAIRILDRESGRVRDEPFLNLEEEIKMGYEQGLLGLAFHPKYAENGAFYVHYIAPGGKFGDGISTVRQFHVSGSDRNIADAASGRTVIAIDQPQGNHNGGWIGFSPRAGDENNLYIALGDGGAAFDEGEGHIEPGGNAQNNTTLFGKILRVTVDAAKASYSIPVNNPFAASASLRKGFGRSGCAIPTAPASIAAAATCSSPMSARMNARRSMCSVR